MRLTIQYTQTDEIFPIEIDDDGKIEDIKVMISVEKGITVEEQILMHNGRILTHDQ